MFIFFHSIKTNIRTIRREVFEYSNNIRIFKVARIRIRIVIFVKNYSNIRIIRIFVTTLVLTNIFVTSLLTCRRVSGWGRIIKPNCQTQGNNSIIPCKECLASGLFLVLFSGKNIMMA